MRIKKSDYDKLVERIEKLEVYASNDYGRLEELESEVGERRSSGYYTWAIDLMVNPWYRQEECEPKKLTLWQTIDQFKDLLGVETKTVKAETKLVLKPTKPVTTAAKTRRKPAKARKNAKGKD